MSEVNVETAETSETSETSELSLLKRFENYEKEQRIQDKLIAKKLIRENFEKLIPKLYKFIYNGDNSFTYSFLAISLCPTYFIVTEDELSSIIYNHGLKLDCYYKPNFNASCGGMY